MTIGGTPDRPLDEGGDPACWAHLFDDDADEAAGAGDDSHGPRSRPNGLPVEGAGETGQ